MFSRGLYANLIRIIALLYAVTRVYGVDIIETRDGDVSQRLDTDIDPFDPEIFDQHYFDLGYAAASSATDRDSTQNSNVPSFTHTHDFDGTMYRHELVNGTALYTNQSVADMLESGLAVQHYDHGKLDFSILVNGLAIYTTTYGVLRAVAYYSNSGTIHKVADALSNVGIYAGFYAGLLINVIASAIINIYLSGPTTRRNARREMWSLYDLELGLYDKFKVD